MFAHLSQVTFHSIVNHHYTLSVGKCKMSEGECSVVRDFYS